MSDKNQGWITLNDINEFIQKESQHERQLAEFMQWEYIEDQTTGDGFDFIANDNSKIEAKFEDYLKVIYES